MAHHIDSSSAKHVLGFDLSLAAPAAVALPLKWRPGDWRRVRTWALHTKAPAVDDLEGQLLRYLEISSWALRCVNEVDCKGVFVEDYAFSKNITSTTKLRESGGITKFAIYRRHGIIVRPVAASAARKLLLGKLPKADHKVAVQRFLFDAGAPKSWSPDVCDAYVIAQYGLTEFGGLALTAQS